MTSMYLLLPAEEFNLKDVLEIKGIVNFVLSQLYISCRSVGAHWW